MEHPTKSAQKRPRLALDLTLLAVIGVLLIAALGAGGAVLYSQFYGPAAFVTRYLDLLSTGRAADALLLPGVSLADSPEDENPINPGSSEALLRTTALAPLSDIRVVSEHKADEHTVVTVAYTVAGQQGESSYLIEQNGWVGVVPEWSFVRSPLAEVELTVLGADQFAVNGFEIDRRQISPDGVEAQPQDPLPMLVFTPGLYSVTIDTQISATPGVAVLADSPLSVTPVTVEAQATDEFIDVVQKRVEQFLTECTTQEVLQPTACPFGYQVFNRIASLPQWSIVAQPKVEVLPNNGQWMIPPTDAVAHIEVDIRSLYDGSIERVSEDVAFRVDGTIEVLPDNSVSILVGSPDDAN